MLDLIFVDNTIWILNAQTSIPIYDFDFRSYFPCRGNRGHQEQIVAICRTGAISDYAETYTQLLDDGIRLINSPEQYLRASDLSSWYPMIEDLTPRTRVYESPPSSTQVATDFQFPVFVKGTRQTSRHDKSLSIVDSPHAFDAAMLRYAEDPILRWQPVAIREFVGLRRVDDSEHDTIPSSFEFRTFWWHGRLVGAGRYWWQGREYNWTDDERLSAIRVAAEAVQRIQVPFLVVDIAMTKGAKWIVIECNDGQESGYAGVSPLGLWQSIINVEAEIRQG